MHEMQTIVTDVCGVCLSVCLSRGLNRRRRVRCTPRAVCTGSFGAAFIKLLWPLVGVCGYSSSGQGQGHGRKNPDIQGWSDKQSCYMHSIDADVF